MANSYLVNGLLCGCPSLSARSNCVKTGVKVIACFDLCRAEQVNTIATHLKLGTNKLREVISTTTKRTHENFKQGHYITPSPTCLQQNNYSPETAIDTTSM